MSLPSDLDQHSVYLGRVATQLLKSNLYPSYDAAYKAVRLILLDAENIGSVSKLNAVNRAIAKAIEDATTTPWQTTTTELTSLAVYESGYYASLIGGYADARLRTPPQKQIQDWMQKALMSLESGQRDKVGTWPEFVKQNQTSLTTSIQNIVKKGYINGSTVNEMVKEAKISADGILRRDAESLVRTGVAFYSNQGRQQMAEHNKDLIAREVPWVTFDNLTSSICRSIDSHYKKGWPVGESPISYPPYHINCLSEDTLVTTCSDVSSVYKRAYKGTMVKLRTESGRSIKITPNHPVLTARGWVKAGELNLLDEVVTIEDVGFFAGEDYKNSTVSKFGEMFSALNVPINSDRIRVRPTSAKDFHGDVTDTNVEVINVDGFRWDSIRESSFDRIINRLFPFRSAMVGSFNSFRSLNRFRFFNFSSLGCSVGVSSKIGDFIRGCFSHSCKLLFRPISKLSISLFKKCNNRVFRAIKSKFFMYSARSNSGLVKIANIPFLFFSKLYDSRVIKFKSGSFYDSVATTSRNAENLSEFIRENPRGAKLDKVVDLSFIEFSGHVYNLQNKDNWYLSNGIVTHNCRTIILHLVEGQDAPDGQRTAVGGKDTKAARDKFEAREDRTGKKPKYRGRKDLDTFDIDKLKTSTKYDTWLRQQPRYFVEDVLGATRTKLFLDGKLSLSSFSDMTLRQLTLDELRVRDASVFKRLGI